MRFVQTMSLAAAVSRLKGEITHGTDDPHDKARSGPNRLHPIAAGYCMELDTTLWTDCASPLCLLISDADVRNGTTGLGKPSNICEWAAPQATGPLRTTL